MPAVSLTPADLQHFADIPEAKAQEMIKDAVALAARIAPCILSEDFKYADAAKAIIREAILRRNESGTGVFTQQGAGPFQVSTDTRQPRRALFRPDEIQQLQQMCKETTARAFAIDTAPGYRRVHALACALTFGAVYCSCGVDLTGDYPLWEHDSGY